MDIGLPNWKAHRSCYQKSNIYTKL